MKITRSNIAAYTTVFTLNEAKAYLRVDNTDEDALIGSLAGAAVRACENYTGHAFTAGDWVLYLDEAELEALQWDITMPVGPAASASNWAVAYRNTGNTYTALVAESDYYIGAQVPARLLVVNAPSTLHDSGLETLRITLASAGYTSGTVPGDYLAAVYMMLAHLFENRETVTIGASVAELPYGVKHLLAPYIVTPHL